MLRSVACSPRSISRILPSEAGLRGGGAWEGVEAEVMLVDEEDLAC